MEIKVLSESFKNQSLDFGSAYSVPCDLRVLQLKLTYISEPSSKYDYFQVREKKFMGLDLLTT